MKKIKNRKKPNRDERKIKMAKQNKDNKRIVVSMIKEDE